MLISWALLNQYLEVLCDNDDLLAAAATMTNWASGSISLYRELTSLDAFRNNAYYWKPRMLFGHIGTS